MSRKRPGGQTQAGRRLEQVLDAGGPTALTIKLHYHPNHLRNLCKGLRGPELRTAFELEDLTAGEVPARGWLSLVSE